MKKYYVISFVFIVNILLNSCSTFSSNKEEFGLITPYLIDLNKPINLYSSENDRGLADSIWDELVNYGFKVSMLNKYDTSSNNHTGYSIRYTFTTAFSSWSMRVVLKIVDITVFNEENETLIKYNWKIRQNAANNAREIAKEFMYHFINQK